MFAAIIDPFTDRVETLQIQAIDAVVGLAADVYQF